MSKNLIIVLCVVCMAPFMGAAQVVVSGQTAVHFYKSARTQSQRSDNYGRPTFGWEADLFLDGSVTDNVTALSNVRVSDDESINFDYLVIRLTDLTPIRLNIQAGKFSLPFGNLGERRFPRRNPLFGMPLLYEYRTGLPDKLPTDGAQLTTEAGVLANRGQGQGMHLLNLGMYDLGAMLYGSIDIADYAFAVTSGTISSTSYGTGNTNSDLGMVARIAVTPLTGLTIGAAYAWGAYLKESEQALPRNINVNSYRQKAAELDFEFSRGHAILYGEAVYNRWPVPLDTRDEDFNVFGYYLEGKYTLLPRVYIALRFNGMRFGNVQLEQTEQPWDYNVDEWEGGLGYFLDRDVLLKLVRRETSTYGGSRPKDSLTVLQLVVAY